MQSALWGEVFRQGTPLRFLKGEFLLWQGEAGESILRLTSGVVSVVRLTEGGDKIPLALRVPGDLVGDMAVLSGRPRNANVVAASTVTAVRLSASRFKQLLMQKELLLDLLQRSHERQHESDLRLGGARALPLKVRMARFLLAMSENGETLRVRGWSQQDLAEMFGVSLRTCCGVVRELRDEGLLEGRCWSHRLIEIRDPVALRGLASF
ncbi:Crp/Fnr family transcriptional regulator [Streptomyces smyrnaeus]|uniref:Crp/Fnr family transcriptional regulator n=1 Tax=Streptomyces smyrnaeus TaxID=1387713 RepID=A0ABS3XQT4_9ACTN|nr:Crp/Fnr family transcriptional regulator [Streptomyces smyrnaeus]MBO8197765.1 Crp/Fnr family transcriptional regulator [Streptomyces smyrnaeus]